MKCTHCNSTKLIKSELSNIFQIGGDAWISTNKNLKVYVCEECGHIDMFDFSLMDKIKRIKEVEELYENSIKVLNARKDLLCSEEHVKSLQIELNNIEIQLKNLDITLRQQQDLKYKEKEIKMKLWSIDNEIRDTIARINQLKAERDQKISKINDDYNKNFY